GNQRAEPTQKQAARQVDEQRPPRERLTEQGGGGHAQQPPSQAPDGRAARDEARLVKELQHARPPSTRGSRFRSTRGSRAAWGREPMHPPDSLSVGVISTVT